MKQIMFNNTYIIIQETLNKIFHISLFLGFDFILLQRMSSHLEEHCVANFSYLGSKGRTCVMFLKGLHCKNLETHILNKGECILRWTKSGK
jgi:hypothetical protein